jgi:hypothetical protein
VFRATSIHFVSSPSIGPRLCPCLMTERPFICQPRIARRGAGRLKWQEKKAAERGERVVETQERQKALREKDRATIDTFMKMAKEKFG